MIEKRSPLAILRDNYLWGEGKSLCEGEAKGVYLKNRITRAFLDGIHHGIQMGKSVAEAEKGKTVIPDDPKIRELPECQHLL